MLKKLRLITKSISFSWFVSYISVLLIPAFFSLFAYSSIQSVIEKEVNSTHAAMLNQARSIIDKNAQQIEDLALHIALNPGLQSIQRLKDTLPIDSVYSVSRIVNDFTLLRFSNSSTHDFWVTLQNADLIISPDSFTTIDNYASILKSTLGIDLKKLRTLYNTKHFNTFIPFEGYNGTRYLLYIKSLPFDNINVPADSHIFIAVREEVFLQHVRSLASKGGFYIIDSKNEVLASTKPSVPLNISYQFLQNADTSFLFNWNGRPSVALQAASSVVKWRLVTVIPEEYYSEKVRTVRRITLLGLLLCVVFGAIVSYIFLRKNYRPVMELVNEAASLLNSEEMLGENEYSLIRKSLMHTVNERDKLTRRLRQQDGIVRTDLLSRALTGNIYNWNTLPGELESVGIKITADSFVVGMLVIDEIGHVLQAGSKGITEQDWSLARFILRNVFEELTRQRYSLIHCEINGAIFCILQIPENMHEALEGDLRSKAEYMSHLIKDNFGITITASFSCIHDMLSSLPESYREALYAQDFKLVAGLGSVIFYSETNKPSKNYKYSINTEQRLSNFIKSGNFTASKELLDTVLSDNFSDAHPSIQKAKCLLIDIMATMLKTMEDINSDCEFFFVDKLQPVEYLMKCRTIDEMKEALNYIMKEVCDFIQKSKKSHNTQLGQRATEYILNNYTDANLNLSMIANSLDVNASYLSSFYKEQTGVGILDFIHRTRIEKAKELLKASQKSINDICGLVGYTNINSFLRTFRKYEGITPGQFRDLG